MNPDALYLAADVTAFLGRLGTLLILGAPLALLAVIVLAHAVTDARRVIADAPWPPCEDGCHRPDCDHGQALAESFGFITYGECERCGRDLEDCWCKEWSR